MTPEGRSTQTPEITVLHAIRPPGSDTTYATQMRDSAPDGVRVRFFDWKFALRGQYDVLHIHWPEFLVRGQSKRDAALAVIRVPLLLRKIRRDRVAVVRTLHNLAPHENARHPLERTLTRRIDETVHKYVALNTATDTAGLNADVILHGDYVDQFSRHEQFSSQRGRLLYFGLVRSYKGIDSLCRSFAQIDDPDLTLRIVGRPDSTRMRAEVQDVLARDSRVSARLEFVSDAELVREVTSAELVILPYREMHNSGSLLVALSLGTPVLTLDTPANRALANEIGPGWLWLYSGDLTDELVRSTAAEVAAIGRHSDARPSFSGRTWTNVGLRHLDTYADAVSLAKQVSE